MEPEIQTTVETNVCAEQIILSNKYYYEGQSLKKLFSEEKKPICPITGNKIPLYYRNTSYCPILARDSYLCPLTKKLYYSPVLCSDGFFYEKKAIKQRFADKQYTSPNTGEPISQKFRIVPHFNYMLHLFYRDHPEELCNRYDPHETHSDNKVIVSQIIKKRKFNKLVKYKKFDLQELFKNNLLIRLLKHAEEDIIQYVIDNIIDLEMSNEHYKNWYLIHYVTRYCGPHIIKLLISKGINMEVQNEFGWKPIHFMCRYGFADNDESINLIKHVINTGIDMECETNDNWRPVHFVCAYGNRELIEYLLTKNVRFDTKITQRTEEISCDKGKIIRTKKLCNDDPTKLLLGNKNLSEDDQIELICKCKNKAADTPSICEPPTGDVSKNYLVLNGTEKISSRDINDNLQQALHLTANCLFGQMGTVPDKSQNQILSELILDPTKQDTQENSHYTQENSPYTQENSPYTQENSPYTQENSPYTQENSHSSILPEPLENENPNLTATNSPSGPQVQFSEILCENYLAEKISSESDSEFNSGKTYANETSGTSGTSRSSDEEVFNNIAGEEDLELVL